VVLVLMVVRTPSRARCKRRARRRGVADAMREAQMRQQELVGCS
jgi:hypothetical protein